RRPLRPDAAQLSDAKYLTSKELPFPPAAGNRTARVRKAPPLNTDATKNKYTVLVYNTVDPSDRPPAAAGAAPVTLLTVNVAGSGPDMPFLTHMPDLPGFLNDIADNEIKGWKTVVFASTQHGGAPIANNP